MESHTPVNRSWLKALGAIVVIVVAAVGYFSLSTEKAAPPVTFTSLSGEKVSLQSLRGKVVMVNFWATSCTTCVHEMPQMVET
jgi:thiol-disulfide isomerase/thioredoxin